MMIDDSKKFENKESRWIKPAEFTTAENIHCYWGRTKGEPKPAKAPLLTLELIIVGKLYATSSLYFANPGCCMKIDTYKLAGDQELKEILLLGVETAKHLVLKMQTNDTKFHQYFEANKALGKKDALLKRFLENIQLPLEVPAWKTSKANAKFILNPTAFDKEILLKNLPKLPISIYKLLTKERLTVHDRENLKKLELACSAIRLNTVYKKYRERVMKAKYSSFALHEDNITALFKNITFMLPNHDSEFSFELAGVPGRCTVQNKFTQLKKDFSLFSEQS